MLYEFFLKQLAKAMAAAGFDAKYDGMYCRVNGVAFSAEANRKDSHVLFLGSKFKELEDGTFDLTRAIGLLIAELPKKLEEKRRQDAAVNVHLQLRDRYGSAVNGFYRVTNGPALCVLESGKINVSVTVDSIEELDGLLSRLMQEQ